MENFKYFRSSLIFTILCLIGGYFIGGVQGATIAAILGVLEVSLSFDNAVVNSTVLKTMSPEWQHRFITFGMPIAVFGMRLGFPLLIVGVIAHLNPVAALTLALEDPTQYATILSSAHDNVMGFGGAFLFMVFSKFFMDAEKETHWVPFLEDVLAKVGKVEAVQVAFTLGLVVLTGLTLEHSLSFILAGIAGVVTYILVGSLEVLLGSEENAVVTTVAKAGLASFLYLEVLDASFSFDGVIGALALSNNLIIIALGLGIGAMFVRSLTLMMVDKGTLDSFPHLENGAFWAIGVLASIMFVDTKFEIPEVVTGLIGASLIGLAFFTSVLSNKKPVTA